MQVSRIAKVTLPWWRTGRVWFHLMVARGMVGLVALFSVAGVLLLSTYKAEGWMLSRAERYIAKGNFSGAAKQLGWIHFFKKHEADNLSVSLREYELELYRAVEVDFSAAKYTEVIRRLRGKLFYYRKTDCELLQSKAIYALDYARTETAADRGNMKLLFDFIHKYPLSEDGRAPRLQCLRHTHYLYLSLDYSNLRSFAYKRIRISGYLLGNLEMNGDGSAYIGHLSMGERLVQPVTLIFDSKVESLVRLEADGLVAGNKVDICGFVKDASNGRLGKNHWIRDDIPTIIEST